MHNNNYETKCDIVPLGKLDNGMRYYITLALPMSYGWYEDVGIVIEKEDEDLHFSMKHNRNQGELAIFDATIDLETNARLYYHFICRVNGEFKIIKNGKTFDTEEMMPEEQLKLSVNFDVPEWAKGAIMYHIFVDRFRKGRKEKLPRMKNRKIHEDWNEDMIIGPDEMGLWNADFYGGDLVGIEECLDYIKSMGVTILYLSPIVESQSNHRYDTADYMNVDPYAGCNDNLKTLCDAAHKRGMKVILDAVFNHTGNDSKYFNEYGSYDNIGAWQDPNSSYGKFYKKSYNSGKVEYSYWWGMKNLPVCDGYSKEWKDYITGAGGVIDHWFSLGIDGLRLDVADELTDEFIELIRIAVKRNKEDGFIIGEVWKNPMRMNRGYLSSGKGMDTVMDYLFIDSLIRYMKYGDNDTLAYKIKEIREEYPEDTIKTLMNFTSTHDISRAINIFATDDFLKYSEWAWNTIRSDLDWYRNYRLTPEQYKRGRDIFQAYIFILTFMPGILSIFYGDEVGAQGIGNLANRCPYPWESRDKKLLEYFRYIGRIRTDEEFLRNANLNVYDINKNYYMFERVNNDEKVLVTVNRTDQELDYPVPGEYELGTNGIYTLKKSIPGHLNPYGGVAIKKRG